MALLSWRRQSVCSQSLHHLSWRTVKLLQMVMGARGWLHTLNMLCRNPQTKSPRWFSVQAQKVSLIQTSVNCARTRLSPACNANSLNEIKRDHVISSTTYSHSQSNTDKPIKSLQHKMQQKACFCELWLMNSQIPISAHFVWLTLLNWNGNIRNIESGEHRYFTSPYDDAALGASLWEKAKSNDHFQEPFTDMHYLLLNPVLKRPEGAPWG